MAFTVRLVSDTVMLGRVRIGIEANKRRMLSMPYSNCMTFLDVAASNISCREFLIGNLLNKFARDINTCKKEDFKKDKLSDFRPTPSPCGPTSCMRMLCLRILRAFMMRTMAACKYILRSSSTAVWVCSTSCGESEGKGERLATSIHTDNIIANYTTEHGLALRSGDTNDKIQCCGFEPSYSPNPQQ